MPPKSFVIEFRFPEGIVYAGLHKGAYGFAPTLKTAEVYNDAADAHRTLRNAYGEVTKQFGYVVPVKAAPGL